MTLPTGTLLQAGDKTGQLMCYLIRTTHLLSTLSFGPLASLWLLLYETAMTNRATSVASRQTGFAGETVRALASTLLLLGLIGDRRVR